MGGPVHLARRFFGSLSPRPLDPDDEAWARSVLGRGELALWARMSSADRKHAAGVARQVASELRSDATPPVLAAALLHDVGKIESGLGTFGRALATVVAGVAGRHRARSWGGPIGRYLRHPDAGADLLRAAGAAPLTVTWAAEHHLPPERWSLPRPVAQALHDADDD